MSVYTELADYIDELYPNPYHIPHDEKRAVVKIFRKLLTEEEVCLVMKLSNVPATLEKISESFHMDIKAAESFLKSLCQKGIIFCTYEKNITYYTLSPFSIGLLEFLLGPHLNYELSTYMQDYIEEIKDFMQSETASFH